VAVDHDVGKGGAGRGVKQITTRPKLGEHVDCRQAGARVSVASPSGFEVRSEVAACAVGSGAICPSSMRVSFLRAERPESGRHVILETVVQNCGDHHAYDEQDEKADETHPNHSVCAQHDDIRISCFLIDLH
jgi:hypothetical protein